MPHLHFFSLADLRAHGARPLVPVLRDHPFMELVNHKSCPFCGFKTLDIGCCEWGDKFLFYIYCQRCSARGPSSEKFSFSIDAWNMRYDSNFNATIETGSFDLDIIGASPSIKTKETKQNG